MDFDNPYAVITVKYTEEEQETQTVEKTLTIYVGDETGDDRLCESR